MRGGKSKSEELLALQLRAAAPHLSVQRQYRFHPVRKWRSDFWIWDPVWPERGPLLVEVEGVRHEGRKAGGHRSVEGMERDAEKYAEAVIMGFALMRVVPKMVRDGRALQYIERFFSKADPG